MRFLIPLVLAAIFHGCATQSPSALPATVPTIIAHRGASGHAPENTLAAFRMATEFGADFFELDCHLTKDGQVAILHDADLEKTAGLKVNIADLTLAEAQQHDVGSWFSADFSAERIPTLAQSLDVATEGCGVYVEIKSQAGDSAASAALVQASVGETTLTDTLRDELLALAATFDTRSMELTRACIADIRAKRMERRVVIQSFSPLQCFIARVEAPDIRTELLLSDDKDNPAHFDLVAAFGLLIGVEGVNVSKGSLTPERLARLQEAGKTVAVYTVNEPADMRHFAAMGVNAIITDYPRECRAALTNPAQ
jgi:glycerophosphoryl diester phosphodiesterase